MPWMETAPVEQRERLVRDHREDLYPMTELCARYGISRKTGYKCSPASTRPAGMDSAIGAAHRTTARTVWRPRRLS